MHKYSVFMNIERKDFMIKAGIIGATGYAGQELVRILLQHRETEIVWYGSRSYVDQKFSSVFGNVFQIVEDVCKGDDLLALSREADVIFTATPQGYLAGVLNEEILENAKVIDLSADFRIKDPAVYEMWYGIKHCKSGLLPHLFHLVHISAGEGGPDRSGYPDNRCEVRNIRCRAGSKGSESVL